MILKNAREVMSPQSHLVVMESLAGGTGSKILEKMNTQIDMTMMAMLGNAKVSMSDATIYNGI